MKFAVVGDTHYCLNDTGKMLDENGNITDAFLYSAVRKNLAEFAAGIKEEKVDLLVAIGDMIEGGYDNEAEEAGAREILSAAAPEFYLVNGTHDPRGNSLFQTFEHDNCRFILLDYTPWNWDEAQKKLFEEALQKGAETERIFVFSHAPLYPWGRECFDSPWFRNDAEELLKKYHADIYFCGHTHNQSLSMHANNLIQIMASTIGTEDESVLSLNQYHALDPKTENDRLFWGISEGNAPGFWIIECEGEKLQIKWRSLFASAEAVQTERFGELKIISAPPMKPVDHHLSEFDRASVRAGWLNIYSSERDARSHAQVKLNGVEIGTLPANISCTARRFLPLSMEALRSINLENKLEIGKLGDNSMIMSASLEIVLADGRMITSHPMREIFMSGGHYSYEFIQDKTRKFLPGECVETVLLFDPPAKDDSN